MLNLCYATGLRASELAEGSSARSVVSNTAITWLNVLGKGGEIGKLRHDLPNSIQNRPGGETRGEHAQPRVQVITDPLKQLGVAGNGGITLTNVKHAASLVFTYEHGVFETVASKEESAEGHA